MLNEIRPAIVLVAGPDTDYGRGLSLGYDGLGSSAVPN